ncbi:clavesin-1-like [Culicoides brevitarsis]|uniref:clavesin-1-like n=1 Tax=Culicoides brevitarsis TaxID=469753 RepID=UPI00307B3263
MIQSSRYEIRTDDIYITRWLTILDWNPTAAFKRLTRYHKFRKEHPDWHFTRHVSAYDQLLKRNIAVMLPHRDKHGRRVYLMHASKMDTSEVTIEEMGQIDTIWFESILDEAETQQNGVTIIIDMKDVKWRLFKWLTPQNSYYSSVFAEVAPVKAYDIHLVNTSNFVYKFMKIVMPFMMKGVLRKMNFHSSDLRTLHEALGRDCLPPQYGGPAENAINYDELRRKLYKTLEEKEKLILAISS